MVPRSCRQVSVAGLAWMTAGTRVPATRAPTRSTGLNPPRCVTICSSSDCSFTPIVGEMLSHEPRRLNGISVIAKVGSMPCSELVIVVSLVCAAECVVNELVQRGTGLRSRTTRQRHHDAAFPVGSDAGPGVESTGMVAFVVEVAAAAGQRHPAQTEPVAAVRKVGIVRRDGGF